MEVSIFIGSDSDYDVIEKALEILKRFNVSFSLEVTSAHRSPERTLKLIKNSEKEGAKVFIAVAGKAAHLAGFVASHTVHPVIGVPVRSSSLNGLDALLSIVQMPEGIPVATMGLGNSGAANAVLLAIQILSLQNPSLEKKLKEYRSNMASEVEKKSRKIKKNL